MITKILAMACLCLSGLFGYFFYNQYFKWRSCFNELGRCFDPETGIVYHQHSGAAWLVCAVLTLAAFCVLYWRARRSRH